MAKRKSVTPVLILSGYLGSGKTTTLNAVLSLPEYREKRIALIINEFGNVSIDSKLVNAESSDLFELNKGSVFCICTKTDFLSILQTISDKDDYDMVIIEATGIADPRDLEGLLNIKEMEQHFTIQAMICIIDAMNFLKVVAFLRTLQNQVKYADALVINKVDSVTKIQLAKLKKVLQEINPNARIVQTEYGSVSAQFLNSLTHSYYNSELANSPPIDIHAETFSIDGTISRTAFTRAVASLEGKILRLKGWLDFGSGLKYVEYLGDTLTIKDTAESKAAKPVFTVIAWQIQTKNLRMIFENLN